MPLTMLGQSGVFAPLSMPLYQSRISAGFPSPADDYVERSLDLNELCVQHPAATFFLRVQGDSMIDAGIFPDDVLVVDRALEAKQGDIVVAALHGELTVKQLELKPRPRLLPCNAAYQPIVLPEGESLDLFGVVTNVVRHLKR